MLEEIKVVGSADGYRCYFVDKSIDLKKAFDAMILDLGWNGLAVKPGKVIAVIGPICLGSYDHYLFDGNYSHKGIPDEFSDREIKRMSNILKKEYEPYRLKGRFFRDINGDETRISGVSFYNRGKKIMSVSRIYHSWYLNYLSATSNLLVGTIPYVQRLLQLDNPSL